MDSTNSAGQPSDSSRALRVEPRILVSLATYNEAGNVAALIAEIHKFIPHADVLVIDDNSPDGTWKIVRGNGRGRPAHQAPEASRASWVSGRRTLAAMKYAMDHDYDYLQNMDADFSHPPRYLPGILAGMSTVRRDDRLALRGRRRDRELAAPAAGDVARA